MNESRRLAMARAHTRYKHYCSCGKVVHGNGGKANHTAMHRRRGDSDHYLTEDGYRALHAMASGGSVTEVR